MSKHKENIANIYSKDSFQIIALLIVGLILRIYAFNNTHIINEDGVLYINQAKAILQGNWELAKSCGYIYLSLYHFLIPIFFKLSGDWVTGAKLVSLTFGLASIIPLYLIIRKFYSSSISFLASLVFTINPFFVTHSVDVIKGPLFWFFSLLGIYVFVRVLTSDVSSKDFLLTFSCVAFLTSSLARIEGIVFYAGATLFLLIRKKKRIRRLLIFNLPIIFGLSILLVGIIMQQRDQNIWSAYLMPRITYIPKYFQDTVNADLINRTISFFILFLEKSLKVIYLPYVPLFLASFWNIKYKIHKNSIMLFFLLLSILAFITLYIFYIGTQVLSARYTVPLILPLFVFLGTGVENIVTFFQKNKIKKHFILLTLFLCIIALSLPKNLEGRRHDKIIYKKIGTFIAAREENRKTVVAAPDIRIMFYANVHSDDIQCTTYMPLNYYYQNMNYQKLVSFLKKKKVSYFVWSERVWYNSSYSFIQLASEEHFNKINTWNSDRGNFILYQVLH